jgi:hypothetical protein
MRRSKKWTRSALDKHIIREKIHHPRPVVLVMDATYWGRKNGVFVARDPIKKENLFWREIETETSLDYRFAKEYLEQLEYVIQGIVIDGKRGVREVFQGIPFQYCQFHQIKTVTRYLTRRPKSLAGQDLRAIALTLSKTDEKTFTERLSLWLKQYEEFLNERTTDPSSGSKRLPYKHKKLRSAYRSLKTNLPYLFTYQKFPELRMPNTTNSLDGSFSHLKNMTGIHRGKIRTRRYKIIQEILTKKEDEK